MSWIHSLLSKALERASVRAQRESPRAQQLLEELAGRTLVICIRGTPWQATPLRIQSDGHSLRLLSAAAPASALAAPAANADAPGGDAVLAGAPLSLLALLRADDQAPIRRGDVQISGDAQLAQRFAQLARLLLPDLEEQLGQIVGRSPAHLLMRAARAVGDSARGAAWTATQNVAEYLTHERGDLVSHQEAAHALHAVEQAREQLDRLETRVVDLEQRTTTLTGGSEPS